MLPILTAIKTAKLFGFDVLTIIKFGCIITLIASTNIITWKLAQSGFDKERLTNTQAQLQAEKLLSLNYYNDIKRMNDSISLAMQHNKILSERMQQLIKEHNDAPPLPTDCVIDDAGVQFITTARENSMQLPSSSSDATEHSSITAK